MNGRTAAVFVFSQTQEKDNFLPMTTTLERNEWDNWYFNDIL